MSEPIILIATIGSGLFALAIAVLAGLKGWQGWLDLKRFELTGTRGEHRGSAIDRIEMADLKERIRKLEAIASGVDL